MADYAENLFEAMQILINKSIESVSFDKTITATITDNSNASKGEYIVSTGSAKFKAYSTETQYRVNDVVMVTIPQGNYNNQKMIIGKQVLNNDTPMVYKSPLQSMINLTGNIITSNPYVEYYANYINEDFKDDSRAWEDENFTQSLAYQATPMWESNWQENEYLRGYSQIGIQAQFQTWLTDYNTIVGNYGLAVELTFATTDENYSFKKYIFLDSEDFFGDPYNFETYYTQEQVFDMKSFLGAEESRWFITSIKVYPYQRCNFKDSNNNSIPGPILDDFSTIPPNIHIKDLYICFGGTQEDFDGDSASLFTLNSLTYNRIIENTSDADRDIANTKNISLQWIHYNKETKYTKLVEEGELPEGYEIRWYRYKLGAAAADEFCGAGWEKVFNAANNQSEAEKYNLNNLSLNNFVPDPNLEQEKIKVIILKKEEDINNYTFACKTQELIFTNNDSVRNDATWLDINALEIRFTDEEQGKYFIYGKDYRILTDAYLQPKVLQAYFGNTASGIKSLLNAQDCTSITWTFPTENTMLENTSSNGAEATYHIKNILNQNANNNTITLQVEKDGQTYIASTSMLFGTAGTSGSNYTVCVEWTGNINNPVFNITNYQTEKLAGNIILYDQTGRVVPWPSGVNIETSWEPGIDNVNVSQAYQPEINSGEAYYVYGNGNNNINAFIHSSNIENNNTFYQASGNNRYDFNLDTNSFIANNSSGKYVKVTNHYKLVFNAISVISSDEYLAYVNNGYASNPNYYHESDIDSHNTLLIAADYSKATNNNPATMAIWNDQRRYFIKYKDMYILDPWTEYQPTETYYEPHLVKIVQNNAKLNCTITQTQNSDIKQIEITASQAISIDSIYILKLNITGIMEYPLISYIPIALTQNYTNPYTNEILYVKYIEGPTEVRYATTGEVDFNKNAYRITCQNDSGEIQTSGYIDNYTHVGGYWLLIKSKKRDTLPTASANEITLTNTQNELGQHTPRLVPPSVYFADSPYTAVQFKHSGVIIYTQPILVYQDNYPSTTLNEWSGKGVEIQEDNGTILANNFAAGRKEFDNTFTGVVLGDLSKTNADNTITNQTGIYGFNHGAVSYALKDDGTAFFGKDGRGRIYIDGNNATIRSASWRADSRLGMMLDLDDGILDTRSENSQVYISPSSNKLLNIKTTYNNEQKDILFVSDNDYYLKTANYNDDNYTGTKIDLKAGNITSYNLKMTGYKQINDNLYSISFDSTANQWPFGIGLTSRRGVLIDWDGKMLLRGEKIEGSGTELNRFIELNSSSTSEYPLSLGTSSTVSQREFKVGWNGSLQLKGTKSSNYIDLDSSGSDDYPLAIGTNATKSDRAFWVKWDGTLHATNANIEGTITGSSIYLPNATLPNFSLTTDGVMTAKRGSISLGEYTENNNTKYHFTINDNGTLHAEAGDIAGWSLTKDMGLQRHVSAEESADGHIYDTVIRSNLWGWNGSYFGPNADSSNYGEGYAFATYQDNDPLFSVNYKGELTAKKGSIGGWTIESNRLSGGTLYGGSISGGSISGASISGGSISAGGGNFIANSSGVSINGAITANTFYMNDSQMYSKTLTIQIPKISASATSITMYSLKAMLANIITQDANGNLHWKDNPTTYYICTKGNSVGFSAISDLSVSTSTITANFLTTSTSNLSGGCFVAGTKILMANGSLKNIEKLSNQDLIIAYDDKKNKFVIDKVIKLLIHHNTTSLMTILLEDGEIIKSTLSHPFLTLQGWKTIDIITAFKEHGIYCNTLKVGDTLIGVNKNSKIKQITIKKCPLHYDTYNIFVKKYHTYIANNYIVHNAIVIDKQ